MNCYNKRAIYKGLNSMINNINKIIKDSHIASLEVIERNQLHDEIRITIEIEQNKLLSVFGKNYTIYFDSNAEHIDFIFNNFIDSYNTLLKYKNSIGKCWEGYQELTPDIEAMLKKQGHRISEEIIVPEEEIGTDIINDNTFKSIDSFKDASKL